MEKKLNLKEYWNIDFECKEPEYKATLYIKFSEFPKLVSMISKVLKESEIEHFVISSDTKIGFTPESKLEVKD